MAKNTIVDRVADSIIQDIIVGRLHPGDQLPTENELSRKFGAGRNSVREAIKMLEAHGVVHIRRADGTYVAQNYCQKMLDPILYSIILQKNNWQDFVEMRKVIDTGTLHIVTNKIGAPRYLKKLRETFAMMEKALLSDEPNIDEIVNCDTSFHNVITDATKNPQLQSIAEYVTRLTIPSRTKTTEKIIATGKQENLLELHRQILDILENRRVELIDQAVIDHYMYWK